MTMKPLAAAAATVLALGFNPALLAQDADQGVVPDGGLMVYLSPRAAVEYFYAKHQGDEDKTEDLKSTNQCGPLPQGTQYTILATFIHAVPGVGTSPLANLRLDSCCAGRSDIYVDLSEIL